MCKRKKDDRTMALKSVEKALIRKSKRNSVLLTFLKYLPYSLNIELNFVRD